MTPGGGGEGVLRISIEGDDRRIFLSLKFSLPGFLWIRKFGPLFFVWLDLTRDLSRDLWVWGYSKQPEDSC